MTYNYTKVNNYLINCLNKNISTETKLRINNYLLEYKVKTDLTENKTKLRWADMSDDLLSESTNYNSELYFSPTSIISSLSTTSTSSIKSSEIINDVFKVSDKSDKIKTSIWNQIPISIKEPPKNNNNIKNITQVKKYM